MRPLYSPSWHRVAELHPRLSRQAEFHRHEYRGEIWYVVRSPADARVHRLSPGAYALAGRMDGERSTDDVWHGVLAELRDDAPTQDEAIEVLGVLHAADLLRCEVPPDTEAMFRQLREQEEREQRGRLNPISFRIPLLDPDAFLTRFEPWLRPLFTPAGGLLWCALVLAGGLAALQHAPELAAAAGQLGEPASLLAIWFSYPLIKSLHELGHAFAVKRWGGEVHEMGVLFLVLVPVPYVDASASSVFTEKSRRMAVAAAGIAVELALASLATFVWILAEPGAVKHVAYAVMVVGGVSTLFFNGNPLLRFDGYYVLADALEIPNLAAKSDRLVGALASRWVLGQYSVELPPASRAEARWLVGYALASWVYRMAVLLGIAFYLAGRFFVVGVALALFAVGTRVVVPLGQRAFHVLTDPGVGERRGRAVGGSLALVAAIGVLLFGVPIPLHTRSQGVIWLPEHANVRAGTEGFVVEALAEPNTRVEPGDALLRVRDPATEARVSVLEARRREFLLRVQSLEQEDRVRAEIVREQLDEADAALARAREDAGEVLVRSPVAGTFVMAGGDDLIGRYVAQGEVVAHVVDLSSAIARVVVAQRDIGRLRERINEVRVRMAHDLGTVFSASIVRQVPAATDLLPTPVLGTRGGGPFAIDPMDADGLHTLEPVFEFDLALPRDAPIEAVGERVYVRFDHGAEPLARRIYDSLRRAFLGRLGV